MTPSASMSRPCSAITVCSGCAYRPGGSATAHLVSTPPRAAETNEPVTCVDSVFVDDGVGCSPGGAPFAVARPNCHKGSSAHAPASPAPSRSAVRRVSRSIRWSAECQPAGQRAFARIAEYLLGITATLGNPCATPHSTGVATQHNRRRAAAVEQHGVVGTQASEQILDLVGCVAAALEHVELVARAAVPDRGSRRARSAVVELAGVVG